MKQFPHIPPLKCESHPASNICSIYVEQECSFKSRLPPMDNFIDICDLVSTESVVTSFQNIKGFRVGLAYLKDSSSHNRIGQYLQQSQQKFRQIIDNFIISLHKKVDALVAKLIEELDYQKEYLMKTAELRAQYDVELANLQDKIQQVSKLNNYHDTKEWVILKESVEDYVSLFHQPKNQEIQTTLFGLNAQIPKRFNLQPIVDCKVSIGVELDQFNQQLPFIRFSETILDHTLFGNSIIDRITDNRSKTIKLLFSGQRDGMNAAAFWKHCENKGPTIMICESKSGQVFGGYTPCKWINNSKNYQMDESMTSFLFSVTQQQIYPLKNKQYAIYGNICYGPTFGGGHDLNIAADFQSGYSKLSNTYDTSQYQIADPKTHLMGGKTPALKSIEVYLIE